LGLAGQLSAAALYAAFAAALLLLGHRLVVRLTWRAALALAILPLCFTGRALLTGQVYAPVDLAYSSTPLAPYAARYGVGAHRRGILSDVPSAIVPWRKAVALAVGQGEWPLWNPYILCGDPLAGSAQPAPYYPINALSLLLPFALAFTFGAAAQLFAAALAAFLYLRDLGCREVAALLGAVGWALSSFVAFWLEWPLGAAVSLAPLVLLGARRVVRRPGWPAALLLALGLALTVLAGHPESAVHVVALGAVLGIAEAAAVPPRRWRAVAGWTLAAGALALALCAVYLLPLLEVLRQTLQWALRQHTTALATAAPPALAFSRLLASAVPPALDLPPAGGPPPLLLPLASAYAGSVLWGPALYGLARGRWRGRFVVAALGAIGVCAGAKMPGIYTLLGHLPLFATALNERLVFAGGLAVALLAALGVEAWLSEAEKEGAPAGRAARGITRAAALAAVSFLAALAFLWPACRAAGFPAGQLATWALWALAPLAAAVAIPLATRRSRRAAVWGAAALVAVLAVQRTAEMGSFYPTLPARAFYPRVAPLDALPAASDDEPWRAVGAHYELVPNQGTFYGIEDARGYQAILNHRFAELLPLWTVPHPNWFLKVTDLSPPILSFLNVRYALAGAGAGVPGWHLLARGPGSWLWQNPRALPRAFVPRRVRLGVPAGREVAEMAVEKDFGERAWIAPPAGESDPPGPPREEPNGRGWVVARRHGTGLVLTARMKQPGWAVISETAWAGWRARLDGREVPLGIANHAFLALALPAGWHQAELFYRPRSFEIGLALSAAALALLAAVTLAWAFGRRRGGGETAGAAPGGRRVGDRIAIAGEYQHRALHAGPAPQRFWHRAKLAEALACLRLAPGDRVLDAGCGSGLLAAMAAAAPGTTVVGVDANPAAVEFASRTFARDNLAFRRGLVDELDAAPGSFEKISFLEVIEHLSRAQGEAILAQFARLLAPGGRLVLTTPNRASPWPLIEWLLDRLHLVPQLGGEQHEVLYDLDELTAMGEAAGLRLAEWRMIDTVAPWLAWWPALADAVHRLEVRRIRRHGCIMVLAFEPGAASLSAPDRSVTLPGIETS